MGEAEKKANTHDRTMTEAEAAALYNTDDVVKVDIPKVANVKGRAKHVMESSNVGKAEKTVDTHDRTMTAVEAEAAQLYNTDDVVKVDIHAELEHRFKRGKEQ